MRAVISVLVLGILAACAPAVPDSGVGIGFDNSAQARRSRDAQLAGQPLVSPTAISTETPLQDAQGTQASVQPASGAPLALPAAAQTVAGETRTATATSGSADIAAETAAALQASSGNVGAVSAQASPTALPAGNAAISDENDFNAVSGRETIESDAERIARNRAQYQVVEPTELPTRPGGAQPNIVAYALQTTHPRGTRVYSRSGINLAARAERNCRNYASSDLAQAAFLARGGPEKDRLVLDPDGDGYACSWDPAPFRRAVQN